MNPWVLISIYGAGAFLLFGGFGVLVYNRLVVLNEKCKNAFAQIEVQLKRRYDLIPNLVQCVKGYMTHERETLEKVIAARNQAATVLHQVAQRPEDPKLLQAWIGAEGALAGAMSRFSVAIENYPELKANTAVADLTEQLTSTENRIAYARQAYNDWVTGFNSERQKFPNCLISDLIGFGDNRDCVEFVDHEKIAEAPCVALV